MSVFLCDQDQDERVNRDALPKFTSHRQLLKSFVAMAGAIRAIPLLILYALTTRRTLIQEDGQAWRQALKLRQSYFLWGLLQLLGHYPEFRTLYYHRLRHGNLLAAALSVCFRFFYKGQTTLYLECPDIGSGLFLQHAFSTMMGAESIGRNCWINQQVTIGYTDATRAPIIGDHVTIYAGAKVLGPIRIGNHVTIGANAVVLKSVPDDCVVVGVPAQIVRRGGISVREPL
jgi:serine O-acetyltransferase